MSSVRQRCMRFFLASVEPGLDRRFRGIGAVIADHAARLRRFKQPTFDGGAIDPARADHVPHAHRAVVQRDVAAARHRGGKLGRQRFECGLRISLFAARAVIGAIVSV